MDVIACDGCRRSFVTRDGTAMLAAIKRACPRCGGKFVLLTEPRQPQQDDMRSNQPARERGEDREIGVRPDAT
jgi:hypothetical protein